MWPLPFFQAESTFLTHRLIIKQQRGLAQLKAAGIVAILDHHALPGVATPGQEFAGR